MIIDGNHNEGGGQILRTALALSLITQKPFEIINIRAKRPQPGLKNQHLHCIKLIQKTSESKCSDVEIGSTKLRFYPKPLKIHDIELDIQTAGSITLLLQSILLPIIQNKRRKARLVIKGGTDVNWSPQFEYLKQIILPQYGRYADIECFLNKRGYYPKGQGQIEIIIRRKKEENKEPLLLKEIGTLNQIRGIAHASLDLEQAHVADRMAKTATLMLKKYNVPVIISPQYANTASTGCGITLYAAYAPEEMNQVDINNPIKVGADVLGEKKVKAEIIAERCAKKISQIIDAKVPVDEHLCDMLIPLLGIYGGTLKTNNITTHTMTNIYVCEHFLDVKYVVDEKDKTIVVQKEAKE